MSKIFMLGLLLGALPVMASAAPGTKVVGKSVRTTVRLDDLDLGPVSGERAAGERIHRAVVRLCNRLGNPSRADDRAAMADCVHEAQAAAAEQLRRLKVLRASVAAPSRD